MKLFALIAGLFLFLPSPVTAMSNAPQSLDGIYDIPHQIIKPALLEEDETCDPPYFMQNGACMETQDVTDELGLYTADDGDMYFAATVYPSDGFSCTIAGKASPDETGWLFSNMDQAAKTESTYDDCKLHLFEKDGEIHLQSEENASCQIYCGAGASLDNISFPISTKTEEPVSENRIKCMGWLEGGENCDQYGTE